MAGDVCPTKAPYVPPDPIASRVLGAVGMIPSAPRHLGGGVAGASSHSQGVSNQQTLVGGFPPIPASQTPRAPSVPLSEEKTEYHIEHGLRTAFRRDEMRRRPILLLQSVGVVQNSWLVERVRKCLHDRKYYVLDRVFDALGVWDYMQELERDQR
ncbi:hypothetical protein R1flu_017545 [Riccia fluitans]|uniref:Uncharacterized protein n=1 Tax=Riccia fluitans TaxID=41844 RepID=A0ABD1ZEC0_9MARC